MRHVPNDESKRLMTFKELNHFCNKCINVFLCSAWFSDDGKFNVPDDVITVRLEYDVLTDIIDMSIYGFAAFVILYGNRIEPIFVVVF